MSEQRQLAVIRSFPWSLSLIESLWLNEAARRNDFLMFNRLLLTAICRNLGVPEHVLYGERSRNTG